jgi:hypothetical protein
MAASSSLFLGATAAAMKEVTVVPTATAAAEVQKESGGTQEGKCCMYQIPPMAMMMYSVVRSTIRLIIIHGSQMIIMTLNERE